ncbi:MAG: hypothetical protein ACRDJE_13520 [Dehalococcoidia bacterium]
MKIEVVAYDPAGAIHVRCESDQGTIEVISGLRIGEDTAYLDGLHIDGPGAGRIGVRELYAMARAIGHQLGVSQLVIQGGVRTTGANPGRMPRPIVLRVSESEE